MINLIPKDILLGTFMEPAAGEGNILLAVMKEKLKYQTHQEVAEKCFAIEYMKDNRRVMIERAVELLGEENRSTIEMNICCGDGTCFEWFRIRHIRKSCNAPESLLEG